MPQSTTRRRSRRRRNTDSDKQIGRRLKQLWARVPEGLAATIGFAAIVPIGILLMWYGRPNNQVPGAAVITLGLTGLIWQAWKWRLRRIEDQTRRQNYEMRAERRRVRRRREADEVELEHKRVAQDKAAHAGAREAEESRRRLEAEQASVEERRRAGREEAIARDATRLLTLPEADLITAVREAFRARGFAAAPVDDEARRG